MVHMAWRDPWKKYRWKGVGRCWRPACQLGSWSWWWGVREEEVRSACYPRPWWCPDQAAAKAYLWASGLTLARVCVDIPVWSSAMLTPVGWAASQGHIRVHELCCHCGCTDLGGLFHHLGPWWQPGLGCYWWPYLCSWLLLPLRSMLMSMSPWCHQGPHETWGLGCICGIVAVQGPCCCQSHPDLHARS